MAVIQIEATHDCMVDEDNAAANQNGANLELAVDGLGASKKRFFIKWPLTTLPSGTNVLSVRIGLYVLSAGKDGTFPIRIEVDQITSADFDETTLTWDNQPDGDLFGFYFQQDISADHWIWFDDDDLFSDLSTLVEEWKSGATNNYGLRIELDNEDPGETQFIRYEDSEGGKAPIIEIEYYSAETIPGDDPGDDLDLFSSKTHDLLDARYGLKQAYEAIWTINSTENDVTDDLESPGSFRTRLPYLLQTPQLGESVVILDNKADKFSPHNRDSILYEIKYKGTEFKISTGLALPGGSDDMVEQYIGLVDYCRRGIGDRKAEVKLRPRLSQLASKLVTITYGTEHPMDALYDLCINVLDLDTDKVNVKSFFDVKASLGGSIVITVDFVAENGWDAALELARAGRSSLYTDRRGRIAVYYWNTAGLTATGNEIELALGTNITGMSVQERDDLIINKQVIKWGGGAANSYTATDPDSIAEYGIQQGTTLTLDLLLDEQFVVELADAIMALRAQPPIEVKCSTTIETLRIDVADQVVITEASEGFDEKVFVAMQRKFSPGKARGDLVCLAPQV